LILETRQVAIATITWARSAGEEALLRRSLTRLAASGLPVAIADRVASATFTAFLQGLDSASLTVPQQQGLVPQVQASMALAARAGRPFILYTESDKEFFFEHRLHDFLRRAPAEPDVGVVLASRSARSFQTFPPMQRYTESVINDLGTDLLGSAGDYSYGPFLVNATLLPKIATLEHRLGWGWRHATFVAAHRAGLRVVHITDDYACPEDQGSEDHAERVHRMRQLSQNILGLLDCLD
jgi:hypothetical protein